MKKLITLLIIAICFASCDDFEPEQFAGDQTLVYFQDSSLSLDVTIDDVGQTIVQVNASTLSNQDRTIVFEVLPESNASEENYEIPSFSATIPAGEYFGYFVINGIDNSVDQTPTLLILGLVSAGNDVVISDDILEITIRQVCPVPEDFLVGEYAIEDVEAEVGPANSTENFASGIVSIEIGREPTQRVFTAGILPAFAGDQEIVLDLRCNNFVLGLVDPNLTCDEGANSYTLIAASAGGGVDSTYDLQNMQNEYIINYTEDPEGSCGGPFQSSFRLTKIN